MDDSGSQPDRESRDTIRRCAIAYAIGVLSAGVVQASMTLIIGICSGWDGLYPGWYAPVITARDGFFYGLGVGLTAYGPLLALLGLSSKVMTAWHWTFWPTLAFGCTATMFFARDMDSDPGWVVEVGGGLGACVGFLCGAAACFIRAARFRKRRAAQPEATDAA